MARCLVFHPNALPLSPFCVMCVCQDGGSVLTVLSMLLVLLRCQLPSLVKFFPKSQKIVDVMVPLGWCAFQHIQSYNSCCFLLRRFSSPAPNKSCCSYLAWILGVSINLEHCCLRTCQLWSSLSPILQKKVRFKHSNTTNVCIVFSLEYWKKSAYCWKNVSPSILDHYLI